MRRSVVPQLRVIRKGGNVWDTLEKTISQQTHAKMAKSKPAVHIVEGSRGSLDGFDLEQFFRGEADVCVPGDRLSALFQFVPMPIVKYT